MSERETIVVGVDGSPESKTALTWAIEEAQRTDRDLRLVNAWHSPFIQVALDAAAGAPLETSFRQEAELLLEASKAHVEGIAPGVGVTTLAASVSTAVALIRESEQAALVVIGSRGHGGFKGLLVGSVGVQLAGHTECPLVVVREEAPAQGPVLVGVDDSEHSTAIIDLAFAEAAARGTGVQVVHVWHRPVVGADWPEIALELLKAEEERAGEIARAAVETVRAKHPGVDVEIQVIEGSPSAHLVELTKGAQLVVVGARGRGGFAGLVLGSTSQALLHHAHCPVIIGPRVAQD